MNKFEEFKAYLQFAIEEKDKEAIKNYEMKLMNCARYDARDALTLREAQRFIEEWEKSKEVK